MEYLIAPVIIGISFTCLGMGIVFFGRTNISAECGSVPNHPTNECPSKSAGICPTSQPNNDALDMALTFTTFHTLKKRCPKE